MDFKDFFTKLINKSNNSKGQNKKVFNLIALIIVGAILLISYNFFKNTKSTQTVNQNNINKGEVIKEQNNDEIVNTYKTSLQDELKCKLQKIQGVGNVDVMIHFDSGEEIVPAFNVNDSDSITNEEDTAGGKREVQQNNNDQTVVVTNENGENTALIVKKYMPQITGVLIVAQGAEDRITQLRITRAVCTLFNLPEYKVNVYPMEK